MVEHSGVFQMASVGVMVPVNRESPAFTRPKPTYGVLDGFPCEPSILLGGFNDHLGLRGKPGVPREARYSFSRTLRASRCGAGRADAA